TRQAPAGYTMSHATLRGDPWRAHVSAERAGDGRPVRPRHPGRLVQPERPEGPRDDPAAGIHGAVRLPDRAPDQLQGQEAGGGAGGADPSKLIMGWLHRSVRTVMPWGKPIESFLDRYPALRAIGNTPLVPVPIFGDELAGVEVFAKMECLNPGGSLKDRPVLRMLLAALADGRLLPGKTILDRSSGNAGIAYAMVGRMIGYSVEIVMPDNASAERKKRILAHGAQLVYTDALKGYDEALREVHRRYEANPQRYFFCDQY